MADPSNEAASSSGITETNVNQPTIRDDIETIEDFIEPDKKRRKVPKTDGKIEQKLEHRLGGILCCAVCLDLPRAAVYQVRPPVLPVIVLSPSLPLNTPPPLSDSSCDLSSSLFSHFFFRYSVVLSNLLSA